MLQSVVVDSTAGGVTLFTGGRAHLINITAGAADIFIKFDESATVLTAANGTIVKAGTSYSIIPFQGVNSSPYWPVPIKAICATSSTTIVQVAQF